MALWGPGAPGAPFPPYLGALGALGAQGAPFPFIFRPIGAPYGAPPMVSFGRRQIFGSEMPKAQFVMCSGVLGYLQQ